MEFWHSRIRRDVDIHLVWHSSEYILKADIGHIVAVSSSMVIINETSSIILETLSICKI